MNWEEISKQGNLSEAFIKENKNHIEWRFLLENQQFSHHFLEEMKDIVDWMGVSKYQHIDKDFIYKHLELVYFHLLEDNKYLKYFTSEEWEKIEKEYEEMLEAYIHLDIGSVKEMKYDKDYVYTGRLYFVKGYEKLKKYSSFQIRMTCVEGGYVFVQLYGLNPKTKNHVSVAQEDMFENKKEEERLKRYISWFLGRMQYESKSIYFKYDEEVVLWTGMKYRTI